MGNIIKTNSEPFTPEDIILKNDKNLTAKYKDLTYSILNCAFEVLNTLGKGFLEKVYETAMVYELEKKSLKVENQKTYKIQYKDIIAGEYIADLVVDNKVIIEIKVADKISKAHEAQTLNYLAASGLEVALILNFKNSKLEYKRLVS